MTRTRIAYMPLATYPQAVADPSIEAAAAFVASLDCTLHVTTFAVHIPQVSSALGNLLVDVPRIAREAEEKSRAECRRLEGLVQGVTGSHRDVQCSAREVVLSAVLDAAAAEARYYDFAVLPWSGETVAAREMTQSVVFGSGRPAILVPPSARPVPLDRIAIAWDGGRVAARALGDALPFLADGGSISVLTVRGEKPLREPDLAGALVSALVKRGLNATPLETTLGKRSIADALQETALSNGAQLLAMGGFGHSRIRDFVLGGATKGILTQLRLPVLLSH